MNAILQAVYQSLPANRSRTRVVLATLGAALLVSACAANLDGLMEPVSEMSVILRCVMALVGLALIVAGFYLYEFIIQLIGFITGGVFGAAAGVLLAGGDDGGALIFAIIGFVVGGIIGAALAAFLTCASVFLSGFLIGALALGAMIGGLTEDLPNAGALMIGGIIGGIVMLGLYRFWITALTAAVGAVLFGLGIDAPPWTWFLFFLFGIACQYGLGKATGNEEKVKPGYRGAKTTPARLAGAVAAGGIAAAAAVGSGMPAAGPVPQPPAGLPPSAAEKFCPACGKKIRAGAAFCPACGTKQ